MEEVRSTPSLASRALEARCGERRAGGGSHPRELPVFSSMVQPGVDDLELSRKKTVQQEFPLLSPNPCSLHSITGGEQCPGHWLSSGLFNIFSVLGELG